MKLCTLCIVLCVSFFVISNVDGLIESSSFPNFMARCFGFYKKKTSLSITAGGKLLAMCVNYYQWMESSKLNANRKASVQTLQYILNLLRDTKDDIKRYKHKRQKRQAAGLHGPLPSPQRVRKELRAMTYFERQNFFDAVLSAKHNTSVSPNKYDALAQFHTGITSMSAHGGCNFHGWHRMYILMFENALRDEGERFKDVTIPYMDSRFDNRMDDPTQSAMFTHRLMGTCNGVVTGSFYGEGWNSSAGLVTRACGTDGPMMTDEMIYNVTRRFRFGEICGENSLIEDDLENHHNGFHRFCGGQMASLQSSVYDVIFWLHHTFMDLVWEAFRENQRANGVDPETDYPPNPTTMGAHEMQLPNAELGFAGLLVIDGLSNMFTEEWYRYEPSPTCTVDVPDCGNVYLKCVVDHPNGVPRAQCVARTLQEVIEAEKPPPVPCPTLPPTTLPPPVVVPDPNPEVIPPVVTPTIIKPVQNTFCMNGQSDINQWVYLAVKIIFRRPPSFTSYGSYPVERGQVEKRRGDIYSPSAYSNVYRHLRTVEKPAIYEGCKETDDLTTTIYVQSHGLNYEGNYKEFAILDKRLTVTVATAYVAVRKPLSAEDASIALLSAQDKCGRVCKPVCKVPGTEIFRPCSGAVKVTGGMPLQFGNSFGDAVLELWDFNTDKDCPQMTTNAMVVSFYCDFKTDWLWPSIDPVTVPKPTPPTHLEPTTITAACSFGWGCIVRRPCSALLQCTQGELLPCEKNCGLFARCLNNNFYVHRCGRGQMYTHGRGCTPGMCDYRQSRKDVKALTQKLNVETKSNRRGRRQSRRFAG